MSKKPLSQTATDAYDHLSAAKVVRVAKTLFLNASQFKALGKRCDDFNLEVDRWNKLNLKRPVTERLPKKKKIKPCDVIDDLILKHLKDVG